VEIGKNGRIGIHIRGHEYTQFRQFEKYWSRNVYHFCTMQNIYDGTLFDVIIASTIFLDEMARIDSPHARSVIIQRTDLGKIGKFIVQK
jgi:hypothetical protein